MADKPAAKPVVKGSTLTRDEKDGCMIRPCPSCPPHEYQDKKYGQNKRVKNFSTAKKTWACTVCSKYE